uniref:Transmembrane protein 222-like protein n=1 Tax=Callorhinchus milii TaxID=7868 RepID=V9LFP9_CALMI
MGPEVPREGAEGEEEMKTKMTMRREHRFPHSLVWTPIPLVTWIFPFIGHMGICTSSGIIRDFAGPYLVSEDNMAFGHPTKFWQLDPRLASNNWDNSIAEASEEYKHRMHNLCCDNCHSHVAMALNLMRYGGGADWNMVRLCFGMLLRGQYVSFLGFVKTWLPFSVLVGVAVVVAVALKMS